jgi:hypothetical protein
LPKVAVVGASLLVVAVVGYTTLSPPRTPPGVRDVHRGDSGTATGSADAAADPLPVVELIVPALSAEQLRFDITVSNPKPAELLVREIQLDSQYQSVGLPCLEPDRNEYEIEGRLSAVAGLDASGTVDLTGLLRDRRGKPGFAIPITGRLQRSKCLGSEDISLRLPVDERLRPRGRTTIVVRLPRRFDLFKRNSGALGRGKVVDTILMELDRRDFRFQLFTTDPGSSSISGAYRPNGAR